MCHLQVGDRIALTDSDKPRGIVKYCGDVAGTTGGMWVGVDWDDVNRGKHNGSFKNVQYFNARTDTSGSFVRPNVLTRGTDLILEIIKKYADANIPVHVDDDRWEFIDLDKIYQEQKNFYNLKCIVLSNTSVSHVIDNKGQKFEKCVELDLTGTLVRRWAQLFEILQLFPNLTILHLNRTRMEQFSENINFKLYTLPRLLQISLNNAFIFPETTRQLLNIFCSLTEIHIAFNNFTSFFPLVNFKCLQKIDLQGNKFPNFDQILHLQSFPNLEFLNLSLCGLKKISFGSSDVGFKKLNTFFLQENPIADWDSIDEIVRLPALKKLVIKGSQLSGINGLDVRELIIAKIPNLIELDRCDISEVSRRSTELYVFSKLSSESIDSIHFLTVQRLKSKYSLDIDNNPTTNDIQSKKTNFNSIDVFLEYNNKVISKSISLLMSIHRIVGLASKFFDFDPSDIEFVEIKRKNFNFTEKLKRTADNLLNQFNLENNDTIEFTAKNT